MSSSPKKILTIIGSGNSAHVCAGLVHSNTNGEWKLNILTRSPHVFSNPNPVVELQDGSFRTGLISKVSSDPADVIPNADIVLWTGPVHATRDAFESVKDHINVGRTVVSTLFGQGLSHVLALRVFGDSVKFVSFRNIPWLCRCTKKGVSSHIVGAKTFIEAATLNVSQEYLTEVMQPLFITPHGPVIKKLPDFCAIVFNPANQIIHPAVYWGLFRKWNGVDPLPKLPNDGWLYRGMDEIAGSVLEALDEELQNIKNVYFAKFPGMTSCKSVLPLKERILLQYTDQVKIPTTMANVVGTNKAYSMAKTPHLKVGEGVRPIVNHRVVQDDIGWGLCVLVSIGERLNVPTTTMRWLIQWHQEFMGKEFIKNGKLQGKDVKELIVLEAGDHLGVVGGISTSHGLYDEVKARL